jgi:vitamin B12 transporter
VKGRNVKAEGSLYFILYFNRKQPLKIFQKMKKKIFVAAAISFSSTLYAQQPAPSMSGDSSTMDEVVITATKTAIKQSLTGKVVTVINREMIEANISKSVPELLNYQAGLFVVGASNVPGSNMDYSLRGATTSNTLILMDGVPVSDPSNISNYFDLNSINISQVERIEILKGAQSTLWGSNAVAGVINIITKKGGSKRIAPNALLSYGSYNSVNAAAGLAGSMSKFNYNVQYGFSKTDGFSSAYDSSGQQAFDKDGLTRNTLQANIGYQVNSKLSARYMGNYSKYDIDLDAGAFQDDRDYTGNNSNLINSLALDYKTNKYSLNFTNTYINSERVLLDDSSHAPGFATYQEGNYKGNSFVSELFGNFSLGKQFFLLAGVQYQTQQTDQQYLSISSFGPFQTSIGDTAKTNNIAGYASINMLNKKGFNIEAGFRFNAHSEYGNNTTFSFNPSYNIDENTRVFVNISSAFKVPSLYQLYSEYRNPTEELQPEKSMNYEIGVQAFSNQKQNSIRLVAFKRDIKDVIIFYTDPNTYMSWYMNRDEQHDYGFEIESKIALGKMGYWINNGSYVDGEGNDGNAKIKNLYRRPNFTFNSIINVEPVKNLSLNSNFRFVGTRTKGEFDAGPQQMPQYYTIDAGVAYRFKKYYRIAADWRNITDQQYFDVPGYKTRGSNFSVALSVQF